MIIYWLVYLTHNDFKIDVLRKEITNVTGQCNLEAQVKQMSPAVQNLFFRDKSYETLSHDDG